MPAPLVVVPVLPYPLRPLLCIANVPKKRDSRQHRNNLESSVDHLENALDLVTGNAPSRPYNALFPIANYPSRPPTAPGRRLTSDTSSVRSTNGRRTPTAAHLNQLQSENTKLRRELSKTKGNLFEAQKTVIDTRKKYTETQKTLKEARNMLSDTKNALSQAKEQNDKILALVGRNSPPGSTSPPLIGKFDTRDVRPPGKSATKTTTHYSFTKKYSAPPGLPVGLYKLDINYTGKMRICTFASNLDAKGFDMHIDGDMVHAAGSVWLELDPDHEAFQFGRYNTLQDHPWTDPQIGTHSRRVSFARPYAAPPVVVVWLNAFDMGKGKNLRIKTYATDITATGFTVHVDTWDDTEMFSGGATWIAFPGGLKGVASGTFSTVDVRPATEPKAENSAPVVWKEAGFVHTPEVVLGLSELDIGFSKNQRVEASCTDVTPEGMNWHLDSWEDSQLYLAAGSYIALA